MEKIRGKCGGIDIGCRHVFSSLDGSKKILVHPTFTEDFKNLVSEFISLEITSVAMEATGVYWVILYEMLEAAGINVWLVDGRQTKQLPGRKTDIKDCQWIHQLHSYGLLNRCHFTTGELKTLRTYQRLRENHIRSAAKSINQMQKAMIEMNIRISEVISQIHGKSGMAMIEAILKGERDKQVLLNLCDTRIKKNKAEEVLKALEGYYKEEQLFSLQQAYDTYHFYQSQIAKCDEKLTLILEQINKGKDDVCLGKKRKAIRHNKPLIEDLGTKIVRAYDGKDGTELPGVTDYTLLQLLGEVGTDLQKWPSPKQFTSWLGLSPGQNNSGRANRNKKKKGSRRAGNIFKQIANNLINSCRKTAIGAFGRRLKARRGPNIANKAVARKLAELFWRLMVYGNKYVEKGIKQYTKQMEDRKFFVAMRIAKELNMKLVDSI